MLHSQPIQFPPQLQLLPIRSMIHGKIPTSTINPPRRTINIPATVRNILLNLHIKPQQIRPQRTLALTDPPSAVQHSERTAAFAHVRTHRQSALHGAARFGAAGATQEIVAFVVLVGGEAHFQVEEEAISGDAPGFGHPRSGLPSNIQQNLPTRPIQQIAIRFPLHERRNLIVRHGSTRGVRCLPLQNPLLKVLSFRKFVHVPFFNVRDGRAATGTGVRRRRRTTSHS
mmetsp:Transcript_6774/g.8405  ORF Transcript_6774/g.8405 Transcript_6774/m.8405 type:complete len:228 (+) Transcript_6774:636-1319(+)